VNNYYWYANQDDEGTVQFVALSFWSPYGWYYWIRDLLFNTTAHLVNYYVTQHIFPYRCDPPQEHQRGDSSVYFKTYALVVAYQNLIKIIQFGKRALRQQVEEISKEFKCSDIPRLYSRQMGDYALPGIIPKTEISDIIYPNSSYNLLAEAGANLMIEWIDAMGKDITIKKFEEKIHEFN